MINLLEGLDTKNMDEKTIEILNLMGKSIENAINGYLSDTMSKKDFEDKIADAINQMGSKEELKSVEQQLQSTKEALLKIKGYIEKGENGEMRVKSLEEQIAMQLKDFISEEKGAKVVDLKGACKASPGYKKTLFLLIDNKAAGTVVSSTYSNGAQTLVAPHLSQTVDENLSVEPRANTILRQYANVATIGTRTLTYAEFVPGEGDAEWVPEGGKKPQLDGTLNEVTITAAKVACYAKLTEETLTDLPQLVAEIRAEIINKIGLKEEAGILSGSGQNGEIAGVSNNMPAYNLTAVKIANAGLLDCIVAAYTQIISNSYQNYVPNVVMINPIDWANMAREKDNTGRPLNEHITEILPTGLAVVVSTAIAQGSFIIGDFNYLNIRDYVLLNVTFGWENDDFTKNLVTMLGEKRLMAYIKNQYRTAFVKDTFANVKTALAE